MIIEIAYAYILGLLSILSPCTFIIIPVMLADMSRKIAKIIAFLAGISVVFAVLGVLGAITGKLLTNFAGPYLYLFAGIVTVIAGLNMLGVIELKFPSFFSNIRTNSHFFLGVIYGGVALSCVGPLLASILVFITAKASMFYGFLMMFIFSLGFITPFLLLGFIITDKKVYNRLMKNSGRIRKYGGIVLLIVAVYLLSVALKGII